MTKKKLQLNRLTLRDLTPGELKEAAGGLTPVLPTFAPNNCVPPIPTQYGECIPA